MGLFSCIARFFGWRDGDTSVLRSWSQKTARKHFRSGNGTLDDVIEAFFATIVQLSAALDGARDQHRTARSDPLRMYLGDGCIFEVACYYYFHVDRWLAENRPHARKRVIGLLREQFERTFGAVLRLANVSAIIDDRVQAYSACPGFRDTPDSKESDGRRTRLGDFIDEAAGDLRPRLRAETRPLEQEPTWGGMLQRLLLDGALDRFEMVLPELLDTLPTLVDECVLQAVPNERDGPRTR